MMIVGDIFEYNEGHDKWVKGVILKITINYGKNNYNSYEEYNVYKYSIISHGQMWAFDNSLAKNTGTFFQHSFFFNKTKIIGHMSDSKLLALIL